MSKILIPGLLAVSMVVGVGSFLVKKHSYVTSRDVQVTERKGCPDREVGAATLNKDKDSRSAISGLPTMDDDMTSENNKNKGLFPRPSVPQEGGNLSRTSTSDSKGKSKGSLKLMVDSFLSALKSLFSSKSWNGKMEGKKVLYPPVGNEGTPPFAKPRRASEWEGKEYRPFQKKKLTKQDVHSQKKTK